MGMTENPRSARPPQRASAPGRGRRGRPAALACLLLHGVTPSPAAAAEALPAQQYELVTQIGMPHLDENLRHAATRQARCLDTGDLSQAFPILGDVSLQDCRLVKVAQRSDSATYALRCTGGHGTTGQARWQFDQASIAGTLDVRLGGKNMTFYQRVTGRAVGACQGPRRTAP